MPIFFSEQALLDLHEDALAQFGGPEGLNQRLVDSIAAYPLQKFHYADPSPDIPELAGALAFAAVKFHAFTDGNKRVAFGAMVIFLAQNGFELVCEDDELVAAIRDLAAGDISEEDIISWIRENVVPA